MHYTEYYDYLNNIISYEFRKQVNISKDALRKMYEQKFVMLFYLYPRQRFVYTLVDYVENGKCNLVSSEWNETWHSHKPVLHYENYSCKNYGDLSAVDGRHRLYVQGYQVSVSVDNDAEFIFSFDSDNKEHMSAFYDLFYNYLYDELYRKIIQKRLEKVKEEETNKLLETYTEIIENL